MANVLRAAAALAEGSSIGREELAQALAQAHPHRAHGRLARLERKPRSSSYESGSEPSSVSSSDARSRALTATSCAPHARSASVAKGSIACSPNSTNSSACARMGGKVVFFARSNATARGSHYVSTRGETAMISADFHASARVLPPAVRASSPTSWSRGSLARSPSTVLERRDASRSSHRARDERQAHAVLHGREHDAVRVQVPVPLPIRKPTATISRR